MSQPCSDPTDCEIIRSELKAYGEIIKKCRVALTTVVTDQHSKRAGDLAREALDAMGVAQS